MLRVLLPVLVLAGSTAMAAEPFVLRDGDVVAFVGNTFVEREQRYGFIELALTLAFPDADVAYRNLGWSGDTVDGRARRFFGSTEEGFKHLLDHLDLVKPTVIFVGYGTNEAFEGEEGRAAFLAGYEALLDELEKRTGRIVLLAAPPLDPSASPAPEVAKQVNEELRRQSAVVKELAARRGFDFVDLFSRFEPFIDRPLAAPLTDNGMHFTRFGYALAGRFVLHDLKAAGGLTGPPDVADSGREALRQAIVAKNDLFFHRHRPENETYLRGFRKHEQGNNAVEIYAFEPLVARKDQEIFALRKAAAAPSADVPR